MATRVPIRNVTFPTHLEAFVFSGFDPVKDPNKPDQPPLATGKDLVRLEVYKGWIVTGFGVTSTTQVEREEFVSFLPIRPFVLNVYPDKNAVVDSTVMVTTSSVAEVGDETSVFALEKATVQLEPQGKAQDQCLILRFTLGAEAATVQTICYAVTVLTQILGVAEDDFSKDKGRAPDL